MYNLRCALLVSGPLWSGFTSLGTQTLHIVELSGTDAKYVQDRRTESKLIMTLNCCRHNTWYF